MPLYAEASEVGICNEALGLVELKEITSLDQAHSKAARVCTIHYPSTRDGLQREYPWNFNKARVSLAAAGTAPVYGYARAFALPGDCLRVREVDGCPDDAWQVEANGMLVTDLAAPLSIAYSARVTDVARFDALFRRLLVAELAVAIAPRLGRQRSIKRDIREDLVELRRQAKKADAQERVLEVETGFSPWLEAGY